MESNKRGRAGAYLEPGGVDVVAALYAGARGKGNPRHLHGNQLIAPVLGQVAGLVGGQQIVFTRLETRH